MLTGHSASVVSTCPATGRQIRLTVTPEGIEDLDPKAAVLSLRLPDTETRAANAQATICAYGHFFVDREHASTWPGLHPEAVLLSVEDAAHLAHEIANAAHRFLEKTEV
jgi:alkylmercury lyase